MPETNVPGIDVSEADVPGSAGAPMNAADEPQEPDALLSRLRLIDDQALDERAAAFAQVHDELQVTLEGGDSPRSQG